MEDQKTLKKLPATATKAEICAMFPNMPERKIREYLNETVRAVEGWPEDARVNIKFLKPKHLKQFFEVDFGTPVGYEKSY